MATPTPVSAADGAVGCDYHLTRNQLIFVEDDGDIDAVNLATNIHVILGGGYGNLVDIKISGDDKHAYVTELQGNLWRVDLDHPQQSAAKNIASGMTAPQQIFLDEDHGSAYVVEFAPSGRILRINLSNGQKTAVATGVKNGHGLLLSADRQFAFVTQQTGEVVRINLTTGNRDVLTTLARPFFLASFGSEATILATERDTANRLVQIDLTQTPVAVMELAALPINPSGIAYASGDTIYVASDTVISKLGLSPYGPLSPIFMGIGHVPVSQIGGNPGAPATIPVGMATTTTIPNYFFPVLDAPFGGTLPLMFNHKAARDGSAQFYRVVVDGTEQSVVPFSDYHWNGTTAFDLLTNPSPVSPYYSVRADELWYNAWLGAFLDTSPLSNGLHTIAFRLFNAAHVEIGHITDAGRSVRVLIDNGLPIASIDRILHNGNEVPVCAIEHLGGDPSTDRWTFDITARDPEKHLKGWSLQAVWGVNGSATIDSASYSHAAHVAGEWEGLPPDPHVVPVSPWIALVPGDKYSGNCAHTFTLSVWDRVIIIQH